QAEAMRDASITRPLQDEEDSRPGLTNRRHVFLSGGIVWAMVTLLKPEACDQPMVNVTVEDVDRFARLLRDSGGLFPDPDLGRAPRGKTSRTGAANGGRIRE